MNMMHIQPITLPLSIFHTCAQHEPLRAALQAAASLLAETVENASGTISAYDCTSQRKNGCTSFLIRKNAYLLHRITYFLPKMKKTREMIYKQWLSLLFTGSEVKSMQVTTTMLDVFLACFAGRRDDYAVQRSDGRYTRIGQPLTYHAVFDHLQGLQTIGVYVIDENGLCSFAVLDSDQPTGLADLAVVQQRLLAQGIRSHLEQSRRGAHLWVFFYEPAAPWLVRRWLLPYCPAGVEFYPKQDVASFEHPGSLIRLPFGVHRLSGVRYPFVSVHDGQVYTLSPSFSEAFAWLATVERTPVPATAMFEPAYPATGQDQPHNISFKKTSNEDTVSSSVSTIREWCMQQDPFSVIGRYVELDGRGLGCCPFGSHHDDGVDTHPSFLVYRPTPPYVACWYCHTWGQGGSLFDFLRFYYSLEPRELWRRILSGAQF